MMKRFRHILFAAALFAGALCPGCGEDEDVLPSQQKQIVSFLTGTLKLYTEEEAFDPAAEASDLPFYTTSGETVYRYITNYYDADRSERPLVSQGSTVYLTLSIYLFEYKSITDATVPLYSNDLAKKAELETAGLTPTYWDFGFYCVKVGETPTISGLESALVGCRQSDIVQIYMTYTMGYGGNDWLYAVEPESPLAIFFTVDLVE